MVEHCRKWYSSPKPNLRVSPRCAHTHYDLPRASTARRFVLGELYLFTTTRRSSGNDLKSSKTATRKCMLGVRCQKVCRTWTFAVHGTFVAACLRIIEHVPGDLQLCNNVPQVSHPPRRSIHVHVQRLICIIGRWIISISTSFRRDNGHRYTVWQRNVTDQFLDKNWCESSMNEGIWKSSKYRALTFYHFWRKYGMQSSNSRFVEFFTLCVPTQKIVTGKTKAEWLTIFSTALSHFT